MKSTKFIFSFLLLACLVACSNRSSPSQVAVVSTEAFVNGDLDQYFEYMSVTEEERKDLEALLRIKGGTFREKYEAKGGLENVEVISEEMSEDGMSCEVTVEILFKDGSIEEESVDLVNIDGDWYMPNPMGNKD